MSHIRRCRLTAREIPAVSISRKVGMASVNPIPVPQSKVTGQRCVVSVVARQQHAAFLGDSGNVYRGPKRAAPRIAIRCPADGSSNGSSTKEIADLQAKAEGPRVEEENTPQVAYFLRSNINTLMFLNAVVLLDKGLWQLWDIAYGDGFVSSVASVAAGLAIIAVTRFFNLPLAEWKQRGSDDKPL
jgi:hypothetical protein